MNADMKWLDNPEVFKVNQLAPHSDMTRSATSTPCIRGKEKSTTEELTAWRRPEQKKECFQKQSTIR